MSEDPETIRAYFQASLLVQEMFYSSHNERSVLDIVLKVAEDWELNWRKLYERIWDLALLES